MSIATIEIQPRVKTVTVNNDQLSVQIEDGRTVAAPIVWYPRLQHATQKERNNWRIFEDSGGRDLIFWEQLDELIPVVALLTGAPSRESKQAIARWLETRNQ